MVKVVAKSELKPNCWEKVAPLYQELIDKTRKENGCIEYSLYIDTKNENACCMIESWESPEDLNAHMKSEHYLRIIPILNEYRVSPSTITLLREFKLQ